MAGPRAPKSRPKRAGSRLSRARAPKPAPRSPPRDYFKRFLDDSRRLLVILEYFLRDIAIFLVLAGLRPPQNGSSKSFTPKGERAKNIVFLTSAQKVDFSSVFSPKLRNSNIYLATKQKKRKFLLQIQPTEKTSQILNFFVQNSEII